MKTLLLLEMKCVKCGDGNSYGEVNTDLGYVCRGCRQKHGIPEKSLSNSPSKSVKFDRILSEDEMIDEYNVAGDSIWPPARGSSLAKLAFNADPNITFGTIVWEDLDAGVSPGDLDGSGEPPLPAIAINGSHEYPTHYYDFGDGDWHDIAKL